MLRVIIVTVRTLLKATRCAACTVEAAQPKTTRAMIRVRNRLLERITRRFMSVSFHWMITAGKPSLPDATPARSLRDEAGERIAHPCDLSELFAGRES